MGKSVGGVDFPEAIEGRVSGLFRHSTEYEGKKKRHYHNYGDRCLFVYNAYYSV